jgi:hypothetical protein
MSTLTRFNGMIDNPNLPILTSQGLIDQQIGDFLFRLEEQGYTITQQETNAVTNFINTIRNHPDYGDMTSYVRAVYPFIGDSNNLSAAKVAIYSDTLFNFQDAFDSFAFDENNKIQGITATPAGALKLSDVAEDKFMDVVFAVKKPQTASQSEIDIFRFGTSDQIGYRLDDYKLNIRFRRNGGVRNTSLVNSMSNPSDAGFYQFRGGVKNNDTANGQYVRSWKKYGETAGGAAGAGATSNPFNVSFTESDLNLPLLANTLPTGYSIQCILVFAKRTVLFSFWHNAVEQLMIDLGRIQSNNS